MAADIELSLLRSFPVAVRTGSLNRAAHALALTQPAVSQQLGRLESLLWRMLGGPQ